MPQPNAALVTLGFNGLCRAPCNSHLTESWKHPPATTQTSRYHDDKKIEQAKKKKRGRITRLPHAAQPKGFLPRLGSEGAAWVTQRLCFSLEKAKFTPVKLSFNLPSGWARPWH